MSDVVKFITGHFVEFITGHALVYSLLLKCLTFEIAFIVTAVGVMLFSARFPSLSTSL